MNPRPSPDTPSEDHSGSATVTAAGIIARDCRDPGALLS